MITRRNFTIGSFKATAAQVEEARREAIARVRLIAAKKGSLFLNALCLGLAGGFVVYCLTLGARLGLGL